MITIWEQAIAEFVGTFALVFIGTGAVMLDGSAGLLGIALAFGLVLAIMVSALGHISGAHFNPAVTIGAWVGGKIETMRAGLYILVQLVAAAAASLVLRALLP